jgi:hypothetical protein
VTSIFTAGAPASGLSRPGLHTSFIWLTQVYSCRTFKESQKRRLRVKIILHLGMKNKVIAIKKFQRTPDAARGVMLFAVADCSREATAPKGRGCFSPPLSGCAKFKRRRIDSQALSSCIISVQKYSAVSGRRSAKCWRRTRPSGGGARFELHQKINRSYKIEGEPLSLAL